MAEVLTTKFKNDLTRDFYAELADNDFYVFVSSITQEGDTRISVKNAQYSKNQFLENTLFGKKLFESDSKFMIKYHPWQKDAVYVQYDDAEDMEGEKFYAVVGPNDNDTGDYRIFKCLFNNNGSPSTAPPSWNAITTNQIYRTADNYVWKFLYAITDVEFEAYNAIGFVPIMGTFDINPDPNADANNVVVGSEISDIFVENPVDNNGYPSISGTLIASPGNDGTLTLRADNLSQINNYYVGMSVYATDSDSVSYLYKIDSYTYEESTGYGKAKVAGDPLGDGLIINSSFTISPTVVVEGDGTGASATPVVIDGNIKTIRLLDQGSGYTNVTARIVDPTYDFDPLDPVSIDVRIILRPILSPFGGHGYNLIDELHCRHILLYGYITEVDNNQIGATNTYSHIGIVKNPEFASASANTANTPAVFDNRIEIVTDNIVYAQQNDIITQVNSDNIVVSTARIHEVKAASNTMFLSNYMGPYANQANNDISIDTSLSFINSTGQRMQINTPTANNITESDYTQRSGEVYFMEDFVPLARSYSSREEYKLILEF